MTVSDKAPAEADHPARGGREAPNWFLYRGQMRAGCGVANDLKHAKQIPASNRPGDLVIGRLDPAGQKVLLSDLVPTHARCTDREINGWYAAWKWPVGKADAEDWSRCGKQRDDASACP